MLFPSPAFADSTGAVLRILAALLVACGLSSCGNPNPATDNEETSGSAADGTFEIAAADVPEAQYNFTSGADAVPPRARGYVRTLVKTPAFESFSPKGPPAELLPPGVLYELEEIAFGHPSLRPEISGQKLRDRQRVVTWVKIKRRDNYYWVPGYYMLIHTDDDDINAMELEDIRFRKHHRFKLGRTTFRPGRHFLFPAEKGGIPYYNLAQYKEGRYAEAGREELETPRRLPDKLRSRRAPNGYLKLVGREDELYGRQFVVTDDKKLFFGNDVALIQDVVESGAHRYVLYTPLAYGKGENEFSGLLVLDEAGDHVINHYRFDYGGSHYGMLALSFVHQPGPDQDATLGVFAAPKLKSVYPHDAPPMAGLQTVMLVELNPRTGKVSSARRVKYNFGLEDK